MVYVIRNSNLITKSIFHKIKSTWWRSNNHLLHTLITNTQFFGFLDILHIDFYTNRIHGVFLSISYIHCTFWCRYIFWIFTIIICFHFMIPHFHVLFHLNPLQLPIFQFFVSVLGMISLSNTHNKVIGSK